MMKRVSLSITEHTLTLSVLSYVIDQMDRGRFGDLLSYLEPEELDELRMMPIRDLLGITSQGREIIHITIDTKQLRGCMFRLRNRSEDESDQLWFVRRGAHRFMMTELFGTTERQFRELRRLAGATDRGRPIAPEKTITETIQQAWVKFDPSLSVAERYRLLGDVFPDLPIGALYSAINEL